MAEHPRLFLGFLLSSSYSEELTKINPHLKAMFIQKSQDYLQELQVDNHQYLGKYLEKPTDRQELQLLEANIYSLLAKLVPNYPYTREPLMLFPVIPHSVRGSSIWTAPKPRG